jgi:hypothetical protein
MWSEMEKLKILWVSVEVLGWNILHVLILVVV